MIVLLDTNIVLDFLLAREPFVDDAEQIIALSEKKQIQAYVTANSITDLFYIMRKHSDQEKCRLAISNLLYVVVDIVSITRNDILKAIALNFEDFEDALQTQCAKKIKAEYIITRNEKDFQDKSVKVVSPQEFLKKIEAKNS